MHDRAFLAWGRRGSGLSGPILTRAFPAVLAPILTAGVSVGAQSEAVSLSLQLTVTVGESPDLAQRGEEHHELNANEARRASRRRRRDSRAAGQPRRRVGGVGTRRGDD